MPQRHHRIGLMAPQSQTLDSQESLGLASQAAATQSRRLRGPSLSCDTVDVSRSTLLLSSPVGRQDACLRTIVHKHAPFFPSSRPLLTIFPLPLQSQTRTACSPKTKLRVGNAMDLLQLIIRQLSHQCTLQSVAATDTAVLALRAREGSVTAASTARMVTRSARVLRAQKYDRVENGPARTPAAQSVRKGRRTRERGAITAAEICCPRRRSGSARVKRPRQEIGAVGFEDAATGARTRGARVIHPHEDHKGRGGRSRQNAARGRRQAQMLRQWRFRHGPRSRGARASRRRGVDPCDGRLWRRRSTGQGTATAEREVDNSSPHVWSTRAHRGLGGDHNRAPSTACFLRRPQSTFSRKQLVFALGRSDRQSRGRHVIPSGKFSFSIPDSIPTLDPNSKCHVLKSNTGSALLHSAPSASCSRILLSRVAVARGDEGGALWEAAPTSSLMLVTGQAQQPCAVDAVVENGLEGRARCEGMNERARRGNGTGGGLDHGDWIEASSIQEKKFGSVRLPGLLHTPGRHTHAVVECAVRAGSTGAEVEEALRTMTPSRVTEETSAHERVNDALVCRRRFAAAASGRQWRGASAHTNKRERVTAASHEAELCRLWLPSAEGRRRTGRKSRQRARECLLGTLQQDIDAAAEGMARQLTSYARDEGEERLVSSRPYQEIMRGGRGNERRGGGERGRERETIKKFVQQTQSSAGRSNTVTQGSRSRVCKKSRLARLKNWRSLYAPRSSPHTGQVRAESTRSPAAYEQAREWQRGLGAMRSKTRACVCREVLQPPRRGRLEREAMSADDVVVAARSIRRHPRVKRPRSSPPKAQREPRSSGPALTAVADVCAEKTHRQLTARSGPERRPGAERVHERVDGNASRVNSQVAGCTCVNADVGRFTAAASRRVAGGHPDEKRETSAWWTKRWTRARETFSMEPWIRGLVPPALLERSPSIPAPQKSLLPQTRAMLQGTSASLPLHPPASKVMCPRECGRVAEPAPASEKTACVAHGGPGEEGLRLPTTDELAWGRGGAGCRGRVGRGRYEAAFVPEGRERCPPRVKVPARSTCVATALHGTQAQGGARRGGRERESALVAQGRRTPCSCRVVRDYRDEIVRGERVQRRTVAEGGPCDDIRRAEPWGALKRRPAYETNSFASSRACDVVETRTPRCIDEASAEAARGAPTPPKIACCSAWEATALGRARVTLPTRCARDADAAVTALCAVKHAQPRAVDARAQGAARAHSRWGVTQRLAVVSIHGARRARKRGSGGVRERPGGGCKWACTARPQRTEAAGSARKREARTVREATARQRGEETNTLNTSTGRA
ncbi:hypothetical protein K438DRAFT_1747189 [Mycena galopus ATCC 62051]|nr:hypothetical protein K438DRAFT_1747189 [Mycena galopus ATCC 62051]